MAHTYVAVSYVDWLWDVPPRLTVQVVEAGLLLLLLLQLQRLYLRLELLQLVLKMFALLHVLQPVFMHATVSSTNSQTVTLKCRCRGFKPRLTSLSQSP